MSNEISSFRQSLNKLNTFRNFTKNSVNIVAIFSNKVEHCFGIVAGVDGVLDITRKLLEWVSQPMMLICQVVYTDGKDTAAKSTAASTTARGPAAAGGGGRGNESEDEDVDIDAIWVTRVRSW